MEHLVDLDAALAILERRQRTWELQGVEVAEVTWRDGNENWPQRLHRDRGQVIDPDSLGIHLRHGLSEVEIVLFRGGWADVTRLASEGAPIVESPQVPDVLAYCRLVDLVVSWLVESS